MLPALLIASILYLGAWAKNSKVMYRIGLCAMFLFVVFRSTAISGYDASCYMIFFDSIPELSEFPWKFWDANFTYGYGWGYALLNSVAKTICGHYFCFQVLDTVLVFALLAAVLRKLKLDDREKCMFLFVYFCSKFIWYYFILLRQNIANLVIWYVFVGWEPVRKHKWLMYLKDFFFITVAVSFHSTAAFMYFAYPVFIIMNWVKEKWRVRIGIAVSLASIVATTYLMPWVWKAVVHIAGERYLTYAGWQVGGINIINYMLRIGYVLLILRFGKGFYKYRNSLNGSLLALAAGSVNVSFNVRFVEFFAVGYYSGVSHIKGYLKRQQRLTVFVLVYLLYIALLLQYILINNPKMIHYQMYTF